MARTELITGGQKSGKSRRAESLAAAWLARDAHHVAVLVATARAGEDEELARRIARHRQDRALRVPALRTLEEPIALAACLHAHDDPACLVVVDCLTLWLANLAWPDPDNAAAERAIDELLDALAATRARVVLVSNEIGLGVVPMGAEVRAFVDALGSLNQRVAAVCGRVTLMACGLPLVLKETAADGGPATAPLAARVEGGA